MDIDRPLDDLIGKDKAPRGGARGGARGNGGPRQSRDRAAPTPYARPPPRSTEDKWVHDAFQGPKHERSERRHGGEGGQVIRSGGGVGFTGVSPRIEVIGLHYEVTPADLKNIFSQAGTLVQGPTIRYDRSGRSKGEAHMEYASYQQAKAAINKFDGAMTKGQTISIRLLPPVVQRPTPARNGSAPSGNLLSRIAGATPQAGPARGAPRGGPRGGGRGRGAPRGGAGPGGGGGKRAPANAGDLDKDLDSFMSGGSTAKAADVDMA